MAELKTQPNNASVTENLNRVEDDAKRQDAFTILEMMHEVTGEAPQMWGNSIVGFGRYRYKYASGREGEWFLTGFAPRKRNLTLYMMAGFDGYDELLSKLGKYKTGKSCLYINQLAQVDPETLRELIRQSVEHMKQVDHAHDS